MKQLLNLFGGVAGLAIAGLVGVALFTVVGGLLIAGGVVVTALLVGGGVYALVTGKGFGGMKRGAFGDVRVFDLRTGQPYDAPSENEMIDITPPKSSRDGHGKGAGGSSRGQGAA
ncbi:hypothetical protein ACT6QH_07245 [Xanthobacter sp. TB0139]|uniref:hypothetical protein n=1 Tax=Xanthobacter sp. TB0139 TaxID=3459178 RepID=UPI00403A7044